MKIFSWVHRRFSHKDGSAQNPKKNADGSTNDNQLPQENTDFLDGWKGGILTIGTFGYDPLKHEAEEHYDAPLYDEEPNKAQAENGSEEVEEEASPLVFAAYEHDYAGLLETNAAEGGSRVLELKKERTTLAELFSAELHEKQGFEKGGIVLTEENKSKFWIGKKLIGRPDARPIHKMNRLMRRMLKRKIHPDHSPNKHNRPVTVAKNREATSDSASLLSTKGA